MLLHHATRGRGQPTHEPTTPRRSPHVGGRGPRELRHARAPTPRGTHCCRWRPLLLLLRWRRLLPLLWGLLLLLLHWGCRPRGWRQLGCRWVLLLLLWRRRHGSTTLLLLLLAVCRPCLWQVGRCRHCTALTKVTPVVLYSTTSPTEKC